MHSFKKSLSQFLRFVIRLVIRFLSLVASVVSAFVCFVIRVVIAQQRLTVFGVTLTMSHALSCARLYM